MNAPATSILRINGRAVDLSRGTVSNGNGALVTLRAQTLAVLKILAAKPGTVVTKDELMAAVWPGLAVTDDSLVQCVTEIRKALGDNDHTIIKTVPKRGYLYEPVRAGPEPRAKGNPRQVIMAAFALFAIVSGLIVWHLWNRPALAPLPHTPGVAVLPFNNLTGDAQFDRLTDGLTEDVTTDIALYPYLRVIARHSTEAYRGRDVDVKAAGKALGVPYLIEGSVQQDNGVLRVTAQLIDAETGAHVWSQRWDRRDVTNIALQDEVAASIAVETAGMFELGAVMRADAAKAKAKAVGARSAYDHFVIAVEAKAMRTKERVAEGFDAINRAIALDPKIALAYSARAWLRNFSTDFGADWNTEMAGGLADAKKGFDLDPQDAVVIATYANFLFMTSGQLADAAAMARKALAIHTDDSFVLCIASATLPYAGYPEEAVQYAARQRAIDPHAAPVLITCPVDAYFFARRFDAAAEVASLVLPESRAPYVRFEHAAALAFLGRKAETEAAKQLFLETRPGATAQSYFTEGWYFVREVEKKLFFDSFRILGLPMCATAEQLKSIPYPEPLPECAAAAK